MPYNLTPKQKAILRRSKSGKTASNYSDAVDGDISPIRDVLTTVADNYTYQLNNHPILGHLFTPPLVTAAYWTKGKGEKVPTGLSNCTLTATQWVNPNQPIMRAQTIIDNGNKYGYVQIPESHVLPGDLVIATNPSNNSHHTMLVHGFTESPQTHTFQGKRYNLPSGHPLVRYSNGTTHPSGYRRSVGLLEYIDNSEGKTDIKYYRHFTPGQKEVLLPEVVVTPKSSYTPKGQKTIRINQKGGQLPIGNRDQYNNVTQIYQALVDRGVEPQAALDLTNQKVAERGWKGFSTGDKKSYPNANSFADHIVDWHGRMFPDSLKAKSFNDFWRSIQVTPKYKYNSENPNYKNHLLETRPGVKKRINFYRKQQGLGPLAAISPSKDRAYELLS